MSELRVTPLRRKVLENLQDKRGLYADIKDFDKSGRRSRQRVYKDIRSAGLVNIWFELTDEGRKFLVKEDV